MDDTVLVRQVLNRNQEAYPELALRCARLILALCRGRVWQLEGTKVLAQEVFLRCLRDLSTLHDPRCFGPWLCDIARDVCRNWLKHWEN